MPFKRLMRKQGIKIILNLKCIKCHFEVLLTKNLKTSSLKILHLLAIWNKKQKKNLSPLVRLENIARLGMKASVTRYEGSSNIASYEKIINNGLNFF
jgi:hypothetical protein